MSLRATGQHSIAAMDLDPKELIAQAAEAANLREARAARLNAAVAVTVALLATFMGICKVKDDNIVQAMQQIGRAHV